MLYVLLLLLAAGCSMDTHPIRDVADADAVHAGRLAHIVGNRDDSGRELAIDDAGEEPADAGELAPDGGAGAGGEAGAGHGAGGAGGDAAAGHAGGAAGSDSGPHCGVTSRCCGACCCSAVTGCCEEPSGTSYVSCQWTCG